MGWCGGGTGGVNKQTAECKVDSAAAGPALQRAVRPACLSAGESAPEFRFTFKNPCDDVASVRSLPPPSPPPPPLTSRTQNLVLQSGDRTRPRPRPYQDHQRVWRSRQDRDFDPGQVATSPQGHIETNNHHTHRRPYGQLKVSPRTHVSGLWKLRKLEDLERSQQTPHRQVPAGPDSGCQY